MGSRLTIDEVLGRAVICYTAAGALESVPCTCMYVLWEDCRFE